MVGGALEDRRALVPQERVHALRLQNARGCTPAQDGIRLRDGREGRVGLPLRIVIGDHRALIRLGGELLSLRLRCWRGRILHTGVLCCGRRRDDGRRCGLLGQRGGCRRISGLSCGLGYVGRRLSGRRLRRR